jgi:hypothetical protein
MTPASDRPSPARATAGRQRDRSSRASCGPAARRFPPARPDAGRADPAQLLQDEAPPRRCLPRHLKLRTVETRQEPAHALTVRRRDARPRDLARRRVDPLRSDLRPMLIKPHHDRHAPYHLLPHNRHAQRPARPIAYREPRSVPPLQTAGRAAAIRARLDLRRSTRRTGHLHRRHHASLLMPSLRRPRARFSTASFVYAGEAHGHSCRLARRDRVA